MFQLCQLLREIAEVVYVEFQRIFKMPYTTFVIAANVYKYHVVLFNHFIHLVRFQVNAGCLVRVNIFYSTQAAVNDLWFKTHVKALKGWRVHFINFKLDALK